MTQWTGALPQSSPEPESTLATIRDCLQNIRFGSIALTIHEGKVVQLDVTEKKRLVR